MTETDTNLYLSEHAETENVHLFQNQSYLTFKYVVDLFREGT